MRRLAEPFERLHRDCDGPGAGLGLSIVRAVADAHGARLDLRPRAGGGLVAEVAFGSDLVVDARRGRGRGGAVPAAGLCEIADESISSIVRCWAANAERCRSASTPTRPCTETPIIATPAHSAAAKTDRVALLPMARSQAGQH